MWKKALYLFVLLVLALVIFLLNGLLFGSQNPVWIIVYAAALWLVVPYLPGLLRRTSDTVWISVGLLTLLGMIQPSAIVNQHPEPRLLYPILMRLIFLLPSVAVLIGAVLLYSGMNQYKTWRDTGTRAGESLNDLRSGKKRTMFLTFILLALLVARTAINFYWLMVWDSAGDSLDYFFLVPPVAASLISGALLLYLMPGKSRWSAIYGLLVPVLLVAVSVSAKSIGFRQRTEEGAARVTRSIETYYTRQGHYPQTLGQLVPRYMLSMPKPIILYEENWCYDASESAYRLAYVDRQHWSSPELFAHIYSAKGSLPEKPPACDREIKALIQSQPDYFVMKNGR
jgi:hypothetical protein